MLVALLALNALTIIGFLLVFDRQANRHHEDRQAHRLEVVGLCQRIQAPEQAVYEHATREQGPSSAGAFPMTDEQIAEMQERELAIARIEMMENGVPEGLS